MAFCPNCGSQVAGRFCPNCGTDVGAASAAGSAGATPNASMGQGSGYAPPPPGTPIAAPGLTDNVASALCYLGGVVTGIIFLVLAPYNRNRTVRFHAFQSIFLTIGLIVLDILLAIFTGLLYAAHLWFIAHMIWSIYPLAIFIGWLYLMYAAYNNQRIVIPVIGPLAEKQA